MCCIRCSLFSVSRCCGDYIASVCEPGYVCAHVNCRGLPGFWSQIASRQTGSEALHIIAPILLLLPSFPSFLPPIASMLSRLSLTHSLARPALIFVNFRAPPLPSCFLDVELLCPAQSSKPNIIRKFQEIASPSFNPILKENKTRASR